MRKFFLKNISEKVLSVLFYDYGYMNELPKDVIECIVWKLSPREALSLSLACKRLYHLISSSPGPFQWYWYKQYVKLYLKRESCNWGVPLLKWHKKGFVTHWAGIFRHLSDKLDQDIYLPYTSCFGIGTIEKVMPVDEGEELQKKVITHPKFEEWKREAEKYLEFQKDSILNYCYRRQTADSEPEIQSFYVPEPVLLSWCTKTCVCCDKYGDKFVSNVTFEIAYTRFKYFMETRAKLVCDEADHFYVKDFDSSKNYYRCMYWYWEQVF